MWYGVGGSGSRETQSPQDADIAATLQAAVLQGEQPLDMATCLAEEGLDRPFSVEHFLKAAPARRVRSWFVWAAFSCYSLT